MTVEVAIGLVTALLGLGALGFEVWRRRDQAAARRRDARVLAMELLPTVTAIHEDLARALKLRWVDPDHWDILVLQKRHIGEQDVVERALPRLNALDKKTLRPIQGMLSAIRDYHRSRSQTDICQLPHSALAGELAQRRSCLNAAYRRGAEAVKRLQGIANEG